MEKYISELFGTFCLVFFGCASVVTGGFGGVAIALSFGIGVTAMAYAIGSISGAHLNPAVTLGAFIANRLPARDVAPYMISQVAGAILAAATLWLIVSGKASGAPANLAATGWNPVTGYSMASALIAEMLATFVFVTVILNVTSEKGATLLAGLVIGLTLTLIHLSLIPVSGSSLNPARSIGPALFSGATALSQLWLYIAAPLAGGFIAGVVSRAGILEKK